MQTAVLVQSCITPLFLTESLFGEYKSAKAAYAETGSYKPYVSFFVKTYTLSIAQSLGADGS